MGYYIFFASTALALSDVSSATRLSSKTLGSPSSFPNIES